MSKWESEKENLEDLILNQKISYEEIGRRYGCTGSNIKKVAKQLQIELPQKRKINESETFNKGTGKKTYCLNCGKDISHKYRNIYCDNKCQKNYEMKQKYEYFLTSPEDLQRANWTLPESIREFILIEQDHKCNICGIENIWNNEPLTFVFDHIDGNAANNTRENYRAICPNCDSQLDTYKSKNKNSARTYRYNKEWIVGSSSTLPLSKD